MDSLIEQAREFAALKHKDQKRKYSDAPYTTHLEHVAGILAEYGYDSPTLQAAAFLHDTLEKTETKPAELVETFGNDVAELVYWLTDDKDVDRNTRTLVSSWRLSRAPIGAKLIKLADIQDNLSNIEQHAPNSAEEFRVEKKLIVDKMAQLEGQPFMDLPLLRSVVAALRSSGASADHKKAS
jgi:GTP diphosphokinase / guanosine-3',5'-bis(diphosphate) 3'-diphosphatase